MHLQIMSSKDCDYSLGGTNMTELRRAQLRVVAQTVGAELSPQATKQELLQRIVGVLDQRGAPKEIERA